MPALTLFMQLIAYQMKYEAARSMHRFLLHNPLSEAEKVATSRITIYVHRNHIDALNGVQYNYDSS